VKLAISAANPSLDAPIDPRFGRCQYFLIIDLNTLEFDTVPNTSKDAMSGAGISAAQTLVNRDVQTVITGRVGPNASDVLASAGIEILTGASGTIRETLEQFTNGQLQPTPTTQIPTRGLGMGRGRGIGRGRGGVFGRRQTPGRRDSTIGSSSSLSSRATEMSKEQEIQMLEAQIQSMQQQLTHLQKRLEDLKT
jgi:predicted Fe-Mo cluster-binding NifX family protein